MRNTRALLLLFAICATVGCDRITKQMAATSLADAPGKSYLSGIVRLEYAENTGGFLGLGANLPVELRALLFIGATGFMLIGAGILVVRYRLTGWPLLGATMFIAAGASNWVDRVVSSSVVDFMILGVGPVHTGIFNVADAAMMLGAALVVIGEVRSKRSVVQHDAE